MNLIMNEKNEAERIINSGDINTDTGAKLSLLARYYAYVGKKPKEIKKLLDDVMAKSYHNYHADDWELSLQKYVNKKNIQLLKLMKFQLQRMSYKQ